MEKVSLWYWGIVLSLGMCVGYYILPYFFKQSDKSMLDQGFVYGAMYYKDYISRMGTFEQISDSCAIIYMGDDTITVYK